MMKICTGLNEAGMTALKDLLESVGVSDLSDRAMNAWADLVDTDTRPGHMEIRGMYTRDGIPVTYTFDEETELRWEEIEDDAGAESA